MPIPCLHAPLGVTHDPFVRKTNPNPNPNTGSGFSADKTIFRLTVLNCPSSQVSLACFSIDNHSHAHPMPPCTAWGVTQDLFVHEIDVFSCYAARGPSSFCTNFVHSQKAACGQQGSGPHSSIALSALPSLFCMLIKHQASMQDPTRYFL